MKWLLISCEPHTHIYMHVKIISVLLDKVLLQYAKYVCKDTCWWTWVHLTMDKQWCKLLNDDYIWNEFPHKNYLIKDSLEIDLPVYRNWSEFFNIAYRYDRWLPSKITWLSTNSDFFHLSITGHLQKLLDDAYLYTQTWCLLKLKFFKINFNIHHRYFPTKIEPRKMG